MFKTIIVDDEIMARKSLERLCGMSNDIHLISTCKNAKEALDCLTANEVDLMFLDIQMPDVTGIEMLEQITVMPQVIFSTSDKKYAYEAFEYDVTDYLKKPIEKKRFLKAIEKVKVKSNQLSKIEEYSANHEIYIKSEGKYIRLLYCDIQYFENVGDYIRVQTEQGSHLIYGTLKGINSKLIHPRFIKVHRSFIINLDKVNDIEDNTLLINKKVIPISRAHRSLLMSRLNIL